MGGQGGLRHDVHAVVVAGMVVHPEPDGLSRFRSRDWLMIDFHRGDGLIKVGGIALEVYPVSDLHPASNDRDHRDVEVRVIVCDDADLCFVGRNEGYD